MHGSVVGFGRLVDHGGHFGMVVVIGVAMIPVILGVGGMAMDWRSRAIIVWR